jgi:competence protein ComEC
MTGDRTMGRVGRSKAGGDSSTKLGRQGGAPGRGKALGAMLAALACLAVGAVLLMNRSAVPDWPPPQWEMVVCDVGQGDAMLLSTGPNEAVVVDTGPDPAAEDRCLKRFRITTVPLLILTHFHADHIGGLSAVLADTRVREIETTTVDIPPAGAADVRRQAAAAGVPVHPVTAHERRRYGPVSWQVLWPDPAFPLSPDGNAPEDRMPGMGGMGAMAGMSAMGAMGAMSGAAGRDSSGGDKGGGESPGPNNTSIVMAVTINGLGAPVSADNKRAAAPAMSAISNPTGGDPSPALRILLTGDIEQPVQADILSADRPFLRADILKVPHHGSANQDPDFVTAVDPAVSIISVGAGNPYGHPVARTVRLMGTTGARLYRTDLDGAVVVGRAGPAGTGYAVSAERGAGYPPGAPIGPNPGSRGSGYDGSDQNAPHRRSSHRHSRSHS